MKASPSCPRNWQSEAAGDGRLTGNELERAARHREHCPECAAQAQELAALTRRLASLPGLPRDPLTVRRARQRLLASLNESVVTPTPRPWPRFPAVIALLPVAVLAYALFLSHAPLDPANAVSKPIVEVLSDGGAHWQVQHEATLDRVEFTDGVASFKVHPHPGRRVLVQLPDGELQDLGTTFEVTVHAGQTEHISVSEGRVLVRLRGQHEFSLQAGERWQRAVVTDPSPEAVPPSAPQGANMPHVRALEVTTMHSRQGALPAASLASSPRPAATARSLDHTSERTEDAAYLSIVSLLHQQKYAEARARARAYLLQFPTGFRRVEVLNIATGEGHSPRGRSDANGHSE